MASILFVYAKTSISAAKRNAQRHREADGGEISWLNESRRRHGIEERVDGGGVVKELLSGGKDDGVKKTAGSVATWSEEEETIRRRARSGRGRDGN
jgi:hypothetical protein